MNKSNGRGKQEDGRDGVSMYVAVQFGMCLTFTFVGCFQGCLSVWGYIFDSGSHLRPNRWREKECEQKVSNMEVLLIVSPQLFLFSVCQFWLGARCTMCIVQDGLFAEGGPEWMRICFWRGDRQPRVNSLFSICTMLCFCTEYALCSCCWNSEILFLLTFCPLCCL